MPVHLVRHAHAGSRSAWSGDDAARPLSPKGYDQAVAIAELLSDEPVGYLGSSAAARCVETLAPLIASVELDVHALAELAEGSDPRTAVELAIELAPQNPVLCAHGDLIPAMVDELIDRGMKVKGVSTKGGAVSQKASVWTIEFDGTTPKRGTYHPPT